MNTTCWSLHIGSDEITSTEDIRCRKLKIKTRIAMNKKNCITSTLNFLHKQRLHWEKKLQKIVFVFYLCQRTANCSCNHRHSQRILLFTWIAPNSITDHLIQLQILNFANKLTETDYILWWSREKNIDIFFLQLEILQKKYTANCQSLTRFNAMVT